MEEGVLEESGGGRDLEESGGGSLTVTSLLGSGLLFYSAEYCRRL